jgi:hypothetical protein
VINPVPNILGKDVFPDLDTMGAWVEVGLGGGGGGGRV